MATFIVNTSAPKGGDMHYFLIGDTVPDWAFEHLGEHTYSGDDAPATESASEAEAADEESVEDETDDSEDDGEDLAAGNDVDDLDFTGADPAPKKTTRTRRTTKKK